MTPEAFAARHPRVFHLTTPGACRLIKQHGLLSTKALLSLFEVEPVTADARLSHRRPQEVPLEHPVHGRAVLNDNVPLSERALESCLDGGLDPAGWLRMLNQRVFFWTTDTALEKHLQARMSRRAAVRAPSPRSAI